MTIHNDLTQAAEDAEGSAQAAAQARTAARTAATYTKAIGHRATRARRLATRAAKALAAELTIQATEAQAAHEAAQAAPLDRRAQAAQDEAAEAYERAQAGHTAAAFFRAELGATPEYRANEAAQAARAMARANGSTASATLVEAVNAAAFQSSVIYRRLPLTEATLTYQSIGYDRAASAEDAAVFAMKEAHRSRREAAAGTLAKAARAALRRRWARNAAAQGREAQTWPRRS